MEKPSIDYLETHFEIVAAIIQQFETVGTSDVVFSRFESRGRGGLWELAEELTDEFQALYKDQEWDGEWLDVLYAFLNEKL